MSPGRRCARSRGATARSSASPAWWPRLSLISLKWSRSRKRIPTGEPEPVARPQRVVERVDEAEPVGQAGEGVVEDAVAQRLVGGVALEGVGEDVGGGFAGRGRPWARSGAVRWSGRRARRRGGLCRRSSPPGAGGAEGAHHRRHREALLVPPVGDDRRRRLSRAPSRRASRAPAETRRPAPSASPSSPARRLSRRPSRPTSQMQAFWTPSTSPISETAARHQRVGVAVSQRQLAEPRDHRLLGEGALQIDLGVLALADVVEDAVPDRDAGLVSLEHRLVEHPDDPAAAGPHPVLDRAGVAVAERSPCFRRRARAGGRRGAAAAPRGQSRP